MGDSPGSARLAPWGLTSVLPKERDSTSFSHRQGGGHRTRGRALSAGITARHAQSLSGWKRRESHPSRLLGEGGPATPGVSAQETALRRPPEYERTQAGRFNHQVYGQLLQPQHTKPSVQLASLSVVERCCSFT